MRRYGSKVTEVEMMIRRKPLFLLALALFVLVFVSSAGYTGFLDSLELSLEKDIGRDSYESIIAEMTVVQLEPEEEERLQSIFNRLVNACSRKDELEFSLTVVKEDSVNAFALPAGYIFVHTGLLDYVQNDGELAGVLAHEIAHVDRKHGMDAIKRQVGMGLILKLVLDKNKSQETLAKIGAFAINMAQLGYSREAEFEADRYGVIFMEKAGFRKEDILGFWQRMVEETGEQDVPKYLQIFSTHPPTSERIERIKAM